MKRLVLALYRIRRVLFLPSAALLLLNVVVLQFALNDTFRRVWAAVVLAALAVFVLCSLLTIFGQFIAPNYEPRRVASPVRGRWLALNSPATKVPSHGVRMYGQSHAIDLVAEPDGAHRPVYGTGKAMRGSEEYPAFEEPVYAMVDGTVVRSSDWRRDHLSRSNWFGYLYMSVEGIVRELGGPSSVIGNHVTIRSDDGAFATVAHLKKGSAEVAVGDRVRAGQRIGLCGNSGNSSEPHVHAQLSDRKSFNVAQGIPFVFADIALGDSAQSVDGVPATGEHMVASRVEAA